MKLLLYCTKAKPYLNYEIDINKKNYFTDIKYKDKNNLNGKIVAECDFRVEEIVCDLRNTKEKGFYEEYTTKSLSEKELLYASKIDEISFINYLNSKNGYAIHVKNLHIFDEPKELNEYRKRIGDDFQVLGKAPQNMMRCCELKYMIEDYILISIRPEWLCKILNGEKTIECRKRILKEMLNDK